jgi:hypothetical protein
MWNIFLTRLSFQNYPVKDKKRAPSPHVCSLSPSPISWGLPPPPPPEGETVREGGSKEGDKKRLSKQQTDKKLGLQYSHRQEALRIAFTKWHISRRCATHVKQRTPKKCRAASRMAYPGSGGPSMPGPQYVMPPMFSIPAVTWSAAAGSQSVGKFPNPRSVLRICKFLSVMWYQISRVSTL